MDSPHKTKSLFSFINTENVNKLDSATREVSVNVAKQKTPKARGRKSKPNDNAKPIYTYFATSQKGSSDDIYSEALNKQLSALGKSIESKEQQTKEVSDERILDRTVTLDETESNSQTSKLEQAMRKIMQLENLLEDEKKSNEILKKKYHILNQKYVKVLVALSRAQDLLIVDKIQKTTREKNTEKETNHSEVEAVELAPLVLNGEEINMGKFISDDDVNELEKIGKKKQ